MNPPPIISDRELLRQYVEHDDEAAFTEVVSRQADLVYSVALRVVAGEAPLAEDVTQGVFTKLAQQAGMLSRHPTLVAWLHTTTRHAAINALRGERRRRMREREAFAMQTISNDSAPHWEEIQPLLDEAVDQLRDRDRHAVLLRFFKGLSHQEVGVELGLSEDAAKKRVERAVEKLRGYFANRGVTVSSALLATEMSENSVQAAPAGLAAKVTTPAVAGTGAVVTGVAAWALVTFMSTKIKIILAVAAVAILVATVAVKLRSSATPPASGGSVSTDPPNAVQPGLPKISATAPVTPPVVPPAAKSTAPAAPSVAGGPQAELNTSMDNIIAVLQTGDAVTAFERFLSRNFWPGCPLNKKHSLNNRSRRNWPRLKGSKACSK